MRSAIAAIFLCLMTFPALAEGGPDSIRVCNVVGCSYVSKQQATGIPHTKFGTYTKAPKSLAKKREEARPVVASPAPSSSWVAEARRYIGMNARQIGLPRLTLWCGTYLGHIADRLGYRKPRNPHWAADWAEVGPKIPGPQPGAIALIWRGGRIGHVGLVTGIDANGNPIIISGNHNNLVVETAYPRRSVVAYVMPSA